MERWNSKMMLKHSSTQGGSSDLNSLEQRLYQLYYTAPKKNIISFKQYLFYQQISHKRNLISIRVNSCLSRSLKNIFKQKEMAYYSPKLFSLYEPLSRLTNLNTNTNPSIFRRGFWTVVIWDHVDDISGVWAFQFGAN